MPSDCVTQYHNAVEWCVQSWDTPSQSWQTMGGWSCSYDFQLGRLLAYIHYQQNKHGYPQYQLRLKSNDGDIIPGEIFG